jgi:predicted RND superfamily exporter protein
MKNKNGPKTPKPKITPPPYPHDSRLEKLREKMETQKDTIQELENIFDMVHEVYTINGPDASGEYLVEEYKKYISKKAKNELLK